MNNSKTLATRIIDFDGDTYIIRKAEVNVRNNHRTVKVSIKKVVEDEARSNMDM